VRHHFIRSLLAAASVAALTVTGTGQTAARDWPQWRGPLRTGELTVVHTPKAWPAEWRKQWRTEVGEGYSSPVVAGGRVFVHSRRDPQEVVIALDAATGAQVWEQRYQAAFTKNQYANSMAKGPNATPLVSDGRVFTVGVTGIVSAWDAATGKQIWQKDFSRTVDSTKLFCGTAASPILAHGLVVVQVGSDVHGGQIAGLDPATGAAKWTWTGPGPGYASPILVDIAGTSQLITMTNSSVVGVNARTGAGLWSIPFPDEWHENIATPVWTGRHLIVSGTRQGTHAYGIARTGETWTATQAWKNAEVAMYMSSPVYADGVLFGLSAKRKGQFVALDGKTGALKWSSEGRDADHASVLFTATHVVYLTSTGDLVLVKRSAEGLTRERSYDVADSATYAVPLFLDGDLFVRDATGVSRLAGFGGPGLKPVPSAHDSDLESAFYFLRSPIAHRYDAVRINSWPSEMATVLRQYGEQSSARRLDASTSNLGPAR
jgi:outer membrane protein assembly factor BamB